MGIRAREIFNAPFDTLKVISLAGNNPPLSCMNDGLQVSTGASLGRGTIEISSEKSMPADRFFYKDREATLQVKKELVSSIKLKIKDSIEKYGELTPEYFAQIRKLSIDLWYELDRGEIFDEIASFRLGWIIPWLPSITTGLLEIIILLRDFLLLHTRACVGVRA